MRGVGEVGDGRAGLMSLAAKTWWTWRGRDNIHSTDQRYLLQGPTWLVSWFLKGEFGRIFVVNAGSLALISENDCFNALIYIYVLLCTYALYVPFFL